MVSIILLRHSQSTANVDRILSGRLPGVTLTEQGRTDIQNVSHSLPALNLIRHSTVQRCHDSAQVVHDTLTNSSPVMTPDNRFDEIDYGEWSGRKLDDLSKLSDWQQVMKAPHTVQFPGGESFTQVRDRVVEGWNALIDDLPKDGTGLIITHGDIIKILVAHVVGAGLENIQHFTVRPAGTCTLTVDNGHTALGLGHGQVGTTSAKVTVGGEV